MARGGATIATIAKEVGVSVPTVSRVLNGRSDVAPATRRRVEEALARHEYRKPVGAASPTKADGLLDLVFHEFGSAWAQEIIVGVEKAAAPRGVVRRNGRVSRNGLATSSGAARPFAHSAPPVGCPGSGSTRTKWPPSSISFSDPQRDRHSVQ